jgi:hypothetical protein
MTTECIQAKVGPGYSGSMGSLAPVRAVLPMALAAVVAGAACEGSADGVLVRGPASRLVLQPRDAPAGMARFGSAPDGSTRSFGSGGSDEPEPRATWVSRYRQVDPAVVEGPLVVESSAALFDTVNDARVDLARARGGLQGLGGADRVSLPSIGEESYAVTFEQPATPRAVRFVVIAWRFGNATASLTVQGFDVTPEDAVPLARAQQRHLEEAAAR